MSVSKWAYLPDRCDGDVCVGDCDLCSKTQDNVAMMDMDSDTISRKAAIDIASGYCHPSNIAEELAKLPSAHRPVDEWCVDCAEYDHDKHCCPRFNRVIREVVPRWIPCSERLPETNGDYLVTFRYLIFYPVEVCEFKNGKWDSGMYDVVAWMLVPDPYREDGEQGAVN